jgi:uncharacterized integral membrane protein (TIGR00697 family)
MADLHPQQSKLNLDGRTTFFAVLAGLFVTCLVVGDIIGGKLIEASLLGLSVTVTVGMIPFPVTFLLTDLLNEFYGKRAARSVTWIGFGMAVLSYGLIYVATLVPIAALTQQAGWQGVTQEGFRNVFSASQRMILASLIAYLASQLVDIAVFYQLKRRTGQRMLWLRATGSTLISQLLDTCTVNLVAWFGVLPWATLLNIVMASYAIKLLVAVGLTPAIYAGHALVERWVGLTAVPPEYDT